MKRKAVILAMAAMLAVTSLTGCGSVKGNETAITVGEDKVTADVANFYARYTQAQYETYYGPYLGEDMWTKEASEGETYQESVKTAVQEELEELILMEQHMKDYGVELTDKEQKAIKKAAAQFYKDNDEESAEKVSGSEETVERALTLMNIRFKMREAITADVDVKVSDKEAAQKKMDYAFLSYTTTDEDGNETALTDDEKAKLKKDAEDITTGVKAGNDFAKLAKLNDVTMQTITFDAKKDTLEEAFVKEAYKMHKGEIQMIETEAGCYVVRLISDKDADATAQKKDEIVQQRKEDRITEVCDGWKKDVKIDVNKKVWEKMDFSKLRVTVKLEEEQP